MSVRLEVAAKASVSPPDDVDSVCFDLEGPTPDWLERVRPTVELVGRVQNLPASEAIERALELDLDFLCLAGDQDGDEWKQLPVRLIVEDGAESALVAPRLAGAAWARVLLDWRGIDPGVLQDLARRERVVLVDDGEGIDDEVLESIRPFALRRLSPD